MRRYGRRLDSGLTMLVPGSAALQVGTEVAVPERIGVELPGALLEWPLAAGVGDLPTITIRSLTEMDWFWQVFGDEAHLALFEQDQDFAVEVDTARLMWLHKLGRALWARAWWPTSERSGIGGLDPVLIDAEVAALIAALADLADDALDEELGVVRVRRQAAEFVVLEESEDVRVRDVARRALEILEWTGLEAAAGEGLGAGLHAGFGEDFSAGEAVSVGAGLGTAASLTGHRPDYALAAGADVLENPESVAEGIRSLSWQAVPSGIFDAGEGTVHWRVDAQGEPSMHVAVDHLPAASAADIRVAVRSVAAGPIWEVVGSLSATGEDRLALPLRAEQVWAQDWDSVIVEIGVASVGSSDHGGQDSGDLHTLGEDPAMRERIRAHARTRLGTEDELTLLAERQAADEDY